MTPLTIPMLMLVTTIALPEWTAQWTTSDGPDPPPYILYQLVEVGADGGETPGAVRQTYTPASWHSGPFAWAEQPEGFFLVRVGVMPLEEDPPHWPTGELPHGWVYGHVHPDGTRYTRKMVPEPAVTLGLVVGILFLILLRRFT